jgi:uncharacterized membrane protein (UPF0182 family)
VLRVPSGSTTFGPSQVANQFKSETAINTEVSLFDKPPSQVLYGNLLSLPIGEGFLYVEPMYVQGSGASQPLLRRVIVYYGDRVGYGVDLSSALRNLTQGRVGQDIASSDSTVPTTSPPANSPPSTPSNSPSSSSSAPPGNVSAILTQLDAAFARLQQAYKTGDFKAVGEAQADIQRLSEAYLKARSTSPGASPTRPSPTPSHS